MKNFGKFGFFIVGSFLLGFLCAYIIFGLNTNSKGSYGAQDLVENSSVVNDNILGDNNFNLENSETNNISEIISNENSEDIVNENIDYSKFVKGDIVRFGSYEQDNNIYNGKEDIEWIVLMVSKKRSMFLISKDILDCLPYNFNEIDTTWQKSDIRKFLNEDFYNEAFSDDEKMMVMENKMSNLQNTNYKTLGGEETLDKVFLLSESQAKRYFNKDAKSGENESRAAKPTTYAKEKGVSTIVNKNIWYDGFAGFWLRTPGVDQKRAIIIEKDGSIFNYGENITVNDVGVRPCIWIKY